MRRTCLILLILVLVAGCCRSTQIEVLQQVRENLTLIEPDYKGYVEGDEDLDAGQKTRRLRLWGDTVDLIDATVEASEGEPEGEEEKDE